MTLLLDILPSAHTDLSEIGDYFDERSDTVSRRFYDRFWISVRMLAESPELGERWKHRRQKAKGVRVWRVSGFPNYLIFYRADKTTLTVVRVLHGARNYAEEFDQ